MGAYHSEWESILSGVPKRLNVCIKKKHFMKTKLISIRGGAFHLSASACVCVALIASEHVQVQAQAESAHWPGFRGFTQSHADDVSLPLKWSADTALAWEAELPGSGQSSPVIWEDQVFVTSIEGAKKETLNLLCFDLKTGKEIWRRQWASSFTETDSDYISKAAPTPAVDEKGLYVLFESGDLIGVAHDGKELWRRKLTEDYAVFEGNHGQASSQLLTADSVVVLMDHKGASFIAAFDKATGVAQWKKDRDTTSAWSSPILFKHKGREVIVTSASGIVVGYAPKDGAVIWSKDGLDGNNVPSPSAAGDFIVVGSRKKGANVVLRIDADDQLSIAWTSPEATSAFGSPLIHEGRVYFVSDAGIVFCHRLESGEAIWDSRIGDSTWAAPLAAGDRVYFFGKGGKTTILRAGDALDVLAENTITVDPKDRVYGYAVAPGKFVFRLGARLVCVGE